MDLSTRRPELTAATTVAAYKAMNPLLELHRLGQSVWLDSLRRRLWKSGELAELMREDGLGGITSNPATFSESVQRTDDYAEQIYAMVETGATGEEIHRQLVVEDVRHTAELFLPLYEWLEGLDGYVSVDVSPHLAHDTQATLHEARRLWREVNNPNLLIKVPATAAGLPAITQLIAEGINVNATCLFRLWQYREVLNAYFTGLELRLKRKKPIASVASVASFVLHPIDARVDDLLAHSRSHHPAARLHQVRGAAAVATAKIAYQLYQESLTSERFRRLEKEGANPQWMLWVSTCCPNEAAHQDLRYVEPLIGPDTIATMSPDTLAAYREHGRPTARLDENVAEARWVLDELAELGIDMNVVGHHLERQELQAQCRAFDQSVAVLRQHTATRIAG